MAHNFKPITPSIHSDNHRRRCTNCDKFQVYECVEYDITSSKYAWRPLIGPCTNHAAGRPPKSREAILAAIRDGRHTPTEIATHAGLSIPAARMALSSAKRKGLVVNSPSRRGWWELSEVEL